MSHREARPLAGGKTSHRKAGPLAGILVFLKEGLASHREAGPLTGRQGLSKYQMLQKLGHFEIFNKTANKITLLASQNSFGLKTLFLRLSAFR